MMPSLVDKLKGHAEILDRAGWTEAAAVMEQAVLALQKQKNVDDFKRDAALLLAYMKKNTGPTDDFPVKTPHPSSGDFGEFTGTFEAAVESGKRAGILNKDGDLA